MHIPLANLVITGACGGLGRALAADALAQGAKVALVGLDRATRQALAAAAPERCGIDTPDVSDSTAC